MVHIYSGFEPNFILADNSRPTTLFALKTLESALFVPLILVAQHVRHPWSKTCCILHTLFLNVPPVQSILRVLITSQAVLEIRIFPLLCIFTLILCYIPDDNYPTNELPQIRTTCWLSRQGIVAYPRVPSLYDSSGWNEAPAIEPL